MKDYTTEFELVPEENHPDPYSAAHDIAGELGGDWSVIQDHKTGEIYICTEGDV